jgi:tetratricopeptide (TPR) repeat protein
MKIFGFSSIFLLIWCIYLLAYLFVPCCSANSPKAWNLSDENLFFVGREEQLQNIRDFFNKGERRTLALTGASGFGKTQTAKKFAQRFARDYDLIWWFDARQDMPNQFERLTVALNTLLPEKERIISSTMSKEALIDSVKNILRTKPIKYLFIFDNAEDYKKISKFIPYAHQNFRKNILLTSRLPSLWPDRIEIGKFKREESLHLIKANLPKASKEEMIKLAEGLVDYPLELTLATAFIKSHPTTTIDRYLAMYAQKMRHKREGSSSMLLDDYPHTSLGGLEISLKAIEEEDKDALQVLLFMSFLNSKDIPESYVELWLKKVGSSLTADEAIKYIYDQSLIGISETAAFHEKKAMSKKDTDTDKEKDSTTQPLIHYLSLHDLIHQLINENISLEDKKVLIEATTDVLLDVFSGRSFDFIKRIVKEPIHLLHAKKVCENAQGIGYASAKLLQLKVCIFEFLLSSLRDFEGAKAVLEDIEKDRKQGFQLEPYFEALFKVDKAFFETIYNANYDAAISHLKEGLVILNSLQQYEEEKLRAISNLAQYHALRGEIGKAAEIIHSGKPTFKKSKSEHYNCFYLFNWSFILNDQGKFEEAMDVLQQVKIAPQFRVDYPTLYHAMLYQKIEILIKQRRLTEAQKHLTEFENIIKEFFKGRYNTTYAWLGNILYFKSVISIYKGINKPTVIQQLTEAINLYNKTLRGEKKNKFQARTHLALGKAHALNKDYKRALESYLFCEGIYDLIFKEKNSDDVSELYAELAILGIETGNDGLTRKYLKKHIDTFGLDHLRTKEIIKALDNQNLRLL